MKYIRWVAVAVGIAIVASSAPARATVIGVTLSASGSAGDACAPGTPQYAAQGFSSNQSGTTPETVSGSVVGYDNDFGCQNSPVDATADGEGSANYGVLTASTYAGMNIGLVASGFGVEPGFADTFTTGSGGGKYLFIVNTDVSATGTSSGDEGGCPLSYGGYGNNVGAVSGGFSIQAGGLGGSAIDIADWNTTSCSPDSSPTYIYGGGSNPNPETVVFTLIEPGDTTLGFSDGYDVRSGIEGDTIGANLPATGSASVTSYVTIVALDGATFTTGSGTTYQPETTVPEPGTLLLFGSALTGLAALRRRSRLKDPARSRAQDGTLAAE